MKCALSIATAALVLLVGAPRAAEAWVIFTPLGGKNIGDTSDWPAGLKEALARHECVAGLKTDAPTWRHGMVITELCYRGDSKKLNELLSDYAKLKSDKLTLVLHPGQGVFSKSFLKTDPVSFDWQVVVTKDGLFNRRIGGKPTMHLSIQYHVGDGASLMRLEVPPTIEVSAGYDDKYRQAHKDNPAVQAIEEFVRLRKVGKSGE
jgi:hypothetical protein